MTETADISILIVDDAPDVRAMLASICRKIEGVSTCEAESGEEAVKKALEDRPDLILMDLMMPDMDGFEATRRIKEVYPQVVVLAVTALVDEQTERKMVRLGATSYIRKPIMEPARVRYKITNIINYLKSDQVRGAIALYGEAQNPFTQEVRAIKTTVQVATEENMMDFGLWLTERYMSQFETQSREFNSVLDLLYGVTRHSLGRHMPLVFNIEENFEWLFISIPLHDEMNHETLAERFEPVIGDHLRLEAGVLHLRLRIRKETKAIAPTEAKVDESPPVKPQEPQKKRVIEEGEKQLLRQSHVDKISAATYVASLDQSDLHEVEDMVEIEEEWEQAMDDLAENFTVEALQAVGGSVGRYAGVVNRLYEFATLGYALSSLSLLLQGASEEAIAQASTPKLRLLLGGMLEDMAKWRSTIFTERNTGDIHYLDSSLLSSCMQIEGLLLSQEVVTEEDEEGDLELF